MDELTLGIEGFLVSIPNKKQVKYLTHLIIALDIREDNGYYTQNNKQRKKKRVARIRNTGI